VATYHSFLPCAGGALALIICTYSYHSSLPAWPRQLFVANIGTSGLSSPGKGWRHSMSARSEVFRAGYMRIGIHYHLKRHVGASNSALCGIW